MRLSLILIISLSLISCVDSSKFFAIDIPKNKEPVYLYNIDIVNSGFKNISIENNEMYFDDSFIDGELTNIKYNGSLITLNNCSDLKKYKLEEIENLVLTDLYILKKRKRTCNFLSKIKNILNEEKNNVVLSHEINKNVLSEVNIKQILLSTEEKYEYFNCTTPPYNKLSKVCESNSTHINIIPVSNEEDFTVFFVDFEYGRMQDFYTVTLSNQRIESKIQL
ncbi:hypothetical protein [uncultured Psychrobacter sp.]|uniref:hypothetical protein n=1 Tax=uncultured Psychrobacter sp. TaxID=259303 RepID=UPI0034589861